MTLKPRAWPLPLTLVSTANQPSGSELAYRDPSLDVELSMSARPLHQRPMVLVVEEETHERVAIREYLDGAGYEVLEAEDTGEALSLLQQRSDLQALVTD